jgi:hypothetical protein
MALCLALPALAGGWTKELGEVYTKVGADVYRSTRFVAPGQEQTSEGAYLGQQYGVYAEAGVLPVHKGQLSLSAPLVVGSHRSSFTDPLGEVGFRATTARLGDLQVAGQVALHPKLPLAAALAVKIPMYANGEVGGNYPTYAELFPKPGDGQVDLTAWLYGGFAPTSRTFAELGVGLRHRTEAFVGWQTDITFVDGAPFVAKGGLRFGRVLPIVGIDGHVNFRQDDWSRQWLALSGNVLVDLVDGFALEGRLSTELWALNASKGAGGGLGLSFRR